MVTKRIPAGYRPIGGLYLPHHYDMAVREARRARQVYGDSYVVRAVRSGKTLVGYQLYWKPAVMDSVRIASGRKQ